MLAREIGSAIDAISEAEESIMKIIKEKNREINELMRMCLNQARVIRAYQERHGEL